VKYSSTLAKMNNKPHLARTVIEVWRGKRAIFWSNFGTYILLAAFTGVLYLLTHFTLNQSASMPVGLYRITHELIRRGSLVLLKEPLKEIVAVPGDTVRWDAAGVSVNGRLLDNSAIPVGSPYPPYPYTTLKLAPDQYVAMGRHPLSYDARYTGPTPLSLLASTVTPVWTQGAPQ
jgi:type IV secretory pathway protease TraF